MPIYEYRCDNCGHQLETIQKFSDQPLRECPACEQESLRKMVSAAGFRLKGGGWYETDFKAGAKRNVAGDDSQAKSSASDSGSSSGSSDGAGKKTATEAKPSGAAKTGSDA